MNEGVKKDLETSELKAYWHADATVDLAKTRLPAPMWQDRIDIQDFISHSIWEEKNDCFWWGSKPGNPSHSKLFYILAYRGSSTTGIASERKRKRGKYI